MERVRIGSMVSRSPCRSRVCSLVNWLWFTGHGYDSFSMAWHCLGWDGESNWDFLYVCWYGREGKAREILVTASS
jgi:hypothetical protein